MSYSVNTISVPLHRSPRVLILSNHWEIKKQYPASGIFVVRQVTSLRKLGISVSRFDIGASHSPLRLLSKWMKLRRKLRRIRPDIVHAQYGTIQATLAVLTGYPTVISFCGGDLILAAPSVSWLRTYLGFLMSNLAALRAHGIICKSEELRQALWWKRYKAVVIPSGVDLDLFTPGSQVEARQELGWEIGPPIVFFSSGGDSKNKGVDIVHAAMEVVRKYIPNALLQTTAHDVHPTRMPLYFRAADVLVCASKREGSPNVVKEALACNLPVVSTAVGDVGERLAGVYPSEIVRREPRAMGEAIAKILRTRSRCNGRERVMSISQDRVALSIRDVYRSVIALKEALPQTATRRRPRSILD